VEVRLKGLPELVAWAQTFLAKEGIQAEAEVAQVAKSGVYTKDPEAGAYFADLFHLPLLAPHVSVPGVVVELGQDLLQ
jgi:hypothetical protein